MINKGYRVSAVVSQPDRAVGRKQIMTRTPISDFAVNHNIPVIKPASRKDKPWLFADEKGLENELEKYNPEMLVVCYFGQKIPQEILDLPKYGGLNIHPSLLPKYRGSAPAEWAIIMGEKEAGVSVIKMSEKFDEGMIVAQDKEIINESDTSEELYTRLFNKGAELLVKTIPDYIENKIVLIPQDKTKGSYFPRFKREDGFVPWSLIEKLIKGEVVVENDFKDWQIAKYFSSEFLVQSSQYIVARASRALLPWPGLWTIIEINQPTNQSISQLNGKRLKILKSHVKPKTKNQEFRTRLILDEIQLEGKNPMSWEELEKKLI